MYVCIYDVMNIFGVSQTYHELNIILSFLQFAEETLGMLGGARQVYDPYFRLYIASRLTNWLG